MSAHLFASRSRLALAAVLVVVTVTAGSCSLFPQSSTPKYVGPCFRALPRATAALHDRQARLVGVHRVPLHRLTKRLPKDVVVPENSKLDVCAFAFHGPFSANQVDNNQTGTAGRYAIVLVTSKSLELVASFEVDRLPEHFRRTFT